MLDRFLHLGTDWTTLDRIYLWRLVWQAIKLQPWTGWGYGNLYFVSLSGISYDRAHCAPLDWVLWYGLVGGYLYLAVHWIIGCLLFRKGEHLLVAALAGKFVAALFFFDALWDEIMIAMLGAYAMQRRPA